MATVKQVLKTKADNLVYTIDPEASVYEAVALMSQARIGRGRGTIGGGIDSAVCGIVTKQDYARKVILQDRASRTTTVCEIMTAAVMSAHPGATTKECMTLMMRMRIRHLPVIDAGRLVGMISIGDMVCHLIEEQQFAIDQLERYVCVPAHELPTCALTRRSPLPPDAGDAYRMNSAAISADRRRAGRAVCRRCLPSRPSNAPARVDTTASSRARFRNASRRPD